MMPLNSHKSKSVREGQFAGSPTERASDVQESNNEVNCQAQVHFMNIECSCLFTLRMYFPCEAEGGKYWKHAGDWLEQYRFWTTSVMREGDFT